MLKKSLSQNLIGDRNILAKMVRIAGLRPGDTVVEIGAGKGSLTRELWAATGAVFAIEVDRGFISLLQVLEERLAGLTVVPRDVLSVDFSAFGGGKKIKVFGNIPYGITGPILFKLLEEKECIESAFITLQREVAERLVSAPHQRSYGAISVIFQLCADMKIHFHLKPHLFTPPPKVDSSFISIAFRNDGEEALNRREMMQFVKRCFEHKRKLLRNSLIKHYGQEKVDALYAELGLGPKVRAEELDRRLFPDMFRFLST